MLSTETLQHTHSFLFCLQPITNMPIHVDCSTSSCLDGQTGFCRWFPAFRDRIMGNPRFLLVLAIEEVIGCTAKTIAEYQARGKDFWKVSQSKVMYIRHKHSHISPMTQSRPGTCCHRKEARQVSNKQLSETKAGLLSLLTQRRMWHWFSNREDEASAESCPQVVKTGLACAGNRLCHV